MSITKVLFVYLEFYRVIRSQENNPNKKGWETEQWLQKENDYAAMENAIKENRLLL